MGVNAPTNGDIAVGVDDVESGGKSIAKDRNGMNRYRDALVISRLRLAQATGDIELVTMGKLVMEKPSDAVANVADEIAHPLPLQVA